MILHVVWYTNVDFRRDSDKKSEKTSGNEFPVQANFDPIRMPVVAHGLYHHTLIDTSTLDLAELSRAHRSARNCDTKRLKKKLEANIKNITMTMIIRVLSLVFVNDCSWQLAAFHNE